MRRLTRGRGQERGAVAVIVAVLFGMFVLTGVAALTIDAGSLYAERRVLQNGADAASLALAQACANNDLVKCSDQSAVTPPWPDLTSLANLNSTDDGLTDIDSVCGSTAPFVDCASLPPLPATLVACTNLPPTLPATAKWVEVRTKTRSTAANPALVSRIFANLSNPAYAGQGVRACARAAWGPASGLKTVVPVTFSECEWKLGTLTGAAYGNAPPFTLTNPETPLREIALAFNAPADAECATWAGHDLPGGFGWLCHGDTCTPPSPADCSISVDGNGWVDVITGIGGGSDCKPEMNAAVGHMVYLPIFDCMSKTKTFCDNTAGGTHTFYRIKGYAAFFVTAIDIAGGLKKSYRPPDYPTAASAATCTAKGGKCMYGWFVEDFLPASAFIGEDSFDFGLVAVQAAG